MGKIAIVFAGQGAQYSGMGKELIETSPAARAVFDLCDSIRAGTSALCFTGTPEELQLTVNTQPALFAVGLAYAEAVKERGICPDFTAGFSLGEIPALAFSGMLEYEDAFRLVCLRAREMQRCAERHKGAMAAVLRLENSVIEKICGEFDHAYPVNYNCPGQTVVACLADEFESLCGRIHECGGKTIPLAVGGAFHTHFMQPAARALTEHLKGCALARPRIPVYSNVTGKEYGNNGAELIARQVESPVKWELLVRGLIAAGVDRFIEAGAGKTLSGLIRKIDRDVTVCHAADLTG